MTDKPTIPPDFEAATQYRIRLDAMTAERDALRAERLEASCAPCPRRSSQSIKEVGSMIDRYDVYGRSMEDTEPDRDAWFVRFDQHNDRIRELEAALRAQVERLRDTCATVRGVLQSDIIEYDDVRNALDMLDAALAATAPPGEGT